MYKKFTITELTSFTKTLRVLYVEDNKEVQEAVLDLLNNFFENIVVAFDGEEGFEKFQKDSFDLVISDIRMPKMDGIEMSEKIRALDCTIPLLIATAHNESELLHKCIEVGVSAYLLKPINFKQLEKVIKQTCEKIYYMKKIEKYEESLEELIQKRTKELEYTKNKLEEMVNRDAMTNLYNRRYFHDISTTLFDISQREKKSFSALMIDIDKFKVINDTYGHMIGDQVIKLLSDELKNLIRTSDVAIRFGGEEFVILLPNTIIDGAYKIASKIRKKIEKREILIEEKEKSILKFTISIGVSQCDYIKDTNIDNLLHRIDEALYEAKRTGRNKVVLYEEKDI